MGKRQPLPKEPLRLMAISTSGCAGWWYQEWPGKGVLYLPAQVSQYLVEGLPRFIGYYLLHLYASYNFDRTFAATADLYVDIENAFQTLSPGHRGVMLSR